MNRVIPPIDRPGGPDTPAAALPVPAPISCRRRSAKERFKVLIPEHVRSRLRDGFEMLRLRAAVLCGRSRVLSAAYYCLTGHFAREQHAVMYGRMKYLEALSAESSSQFRLRRNIHRLEKGLICRPLRSVFAVDYIAETVDSYLRVLGGRGGRVGADGEAKWAHDVLSRYFAETGPHPVIDAARSTFLGSPGAEAADGRFTPYRRDLSGPPPVSYDDFLRLSLRRRSVRWFEPRPVSRELIGRAVAAASLAPSACNRQPFEFRVYDEPDAVRRVAALPGGVAGFAHNFPAVVVVTGLLRAYFAERDRHLIYIDGALAAMSFMFALETLGLSSCPINWPDVPAKERQAARLLGLEPDERPVMFIAVGHPDPTGMVPYSQKKSAEQLVRYNRLA